MKRRIRIAAASLMVGAGLISAAAAPAFAGEITGNGTLKAVNGNSPCAFSGQEDTQWYTDDSDTVLRDNPIKGVPAHSQNWGHVKQATGLTGGANDVPAAEWGCNGHDFGLK